MVQINFIITTKSEASPGRKEHMKQTFQFLTNLPAPFPSWVHRAQPEVPICFQLSVSSSVFYRGFLLQAQKHPKALTRTRLVLLSHAKIQIPDREKNFLCLF